MAPARKRHSRPPAREAHELGRIARPLSLSAQVEQILRQAIAEKRWARGRLPTEIELAEQLGVSRETVRLAAEVLQREGLLVKIRRKGTFTTTPQKVMQLKTVEAKLLGYLQIDHRTMTGQEDAANRAISGLMLQGAIEEAGQSGFQVVVQHTPSTQLRQGFFELYEHTPLRGVIFASYGEEKLLRRVLGLGLPAVLLDHDLHLPRINSVRDDSFEGARQAVAYLASLGHRRIAFAQWQQADLNPWRLRGYRQGLREANLTSRRSWEIRCELTEGGARQLVQSWVGLSPRPTALYCFNNTLARLCIEEFQRQGFHVPGTLSVMGAGGEDVPTLTCHQTDWYSMGRTAVGILLRAADGAPLPEPEHYLSPHTLRIGKSTERL
jgi:DNA-binding LacI/PurR family transcriptional regulator